MLQTCQIKAQCNIHGTSRITTGSIESHKKQQRDCAAFLA